MARHPQGRLARARTTGVAGMVLLVAAGALALAPVAGAQEPTGKVRLGHLSPGTPGVDITLSGPEGPSSVDQRVGSGVGYGYGSLGGVGAPQSLARSPALPQGVKALNSFIPVARIADLLLKPGTPFEYQGVTHTYPDTRLVYWAGGNPFHHHQDINRLRRAFNVPQTIVVHESAWTPI